MSKRVKSEYTRGSFSLRNTQCRCCGHFIAGDDGHCDECLEFGHVPGGLRVDQFTCRDKSRGVNDER